MIKNELSKSHLFLHIYTYIYVAITRKRRYPFESTGAWKELEQSVMGGTGGMIGKEESDIIIF